MLSRFSSLFTYVVVGLAVSAAATPMGPLGDLGGDGAKALSRPGSSYATGMKPYDRVKPYGDASDNHKPYANDNRKPYANDNGKPYANDNVKSYGGDDMDKPYDNGKDKHYGDNKSQSYGQCSTGSQHCCNQVNRVSQFQSLYLLIHH